MRRLSSRTGQLVEGVHGQQSPDMCCWEGILTQVGYCPMGQSLGYGREPFVSTCMPSFRLYRHVPWFGKIAAKMVLSRVPLSHAVWQRLGLFRHGQMADVEYAYRVFRGHF